MSILDIIANTGKAGNGVGAAAVKGAQAKEDIATSALKNRIKQSEYDEWIENRPTRDKQSQAAGMTADEFTSPEQQSMRSEKVDTDRKKMKAERDLMPSQVAAGIKQNMAKMHEVDVEDLFRRTQSMTPNTTQEEYSSVFKSLPKEYAETLGLTGKVKDDIQKIGFAQSNAIDNLPHLRNLALQQSKGAAAGNKVSKLHKPPAPLYYKDPKALRIAVQENPAFVRARMFGWLESNDPDDPEVDMIARSIGDKANSILSEEHQKAVIQSSGGKAWDMTTPEEALERAVFTQLSLMHNATIPELEYMNPEDAIRQQDTWINAMRPQFDELPELKNKTGAQKMQYMIKGYTEYMAQRYAQSLSRSSENNTYGK